MSQLLTREQAAEARSKGTKAPADRPRERMAQRGDDSSRLWTPSMRARIQLDRAPTEGDDTPSFEGFASVTGQSYEMYDWYGPYDEQVAVGAFEQTLAQDSLDVPLVLDHTSSRRIARTGNASSPLELSEVVDGETTGLLVRAPSLQMSDPDTAYIVPKLRSELIDEMSFRFMITEGRWSEDFQTFTIRAVDIHRGDVSIVGYGASPHTAGAGLRSKPTEAERVALALAKARSLDGDHRYARLL